MSIDKKRKKRASMILLLEHIHTMEELSDEELGQFIRAYATYVESGIEPDFDDRSMRMMWGTVKNFDKANCKKYEATSRARKEAGKKGSMIRWNRECQTIANDNKNSKCHFANGKNSLYESDSESESDSNSNQKEKSKKKNANAIKRFAPPTQQEAEDYFLSKGSSKYEAQKFCAFYESNGWKVGKNCMKNWHMAASGWILRNGQQPVKHTPDEDYNDLFAQMFGGQENDDSVLGTACEVD